LDESFLKIQRIIYEKFYINSLEHDPGKGLQIWKYSMSQIDEIIITYLKWGPYQIQLENYHFFEGKTFKEISI